MLVSRFVAADLLCSAASPQQVVRGIEARLGFQRRSDLVLSYRLLGDIDQLRIPLAALPRRVDGLWKHTCFEAFIGVQDSPAYVEYNFSPSGEWAAYRFRSYRDGGPFEDKSLTPDISVEHSTDQLTLTAMIRLDRLALIRPGPTFRVGLSAVIEAADGALSYWALKHPGEKPDFHHADSFVLELALPGNSA
jgi:hypothetical protein